MNKNIPPLALLALLALGGGLVLVSRKATTLRPQPGAAVASRTVAEERVSSSARAALPMSGPARDGVGRAQRTEAAGGAFVRRDVADVFRACVPPAGDWRHGHPTRMVVSPYPGMTVAFQQVRTREDGRHLTWIGRNPELPGASFVGIATPDGYDAVMIVPGAGQQNFHVRDGRVLVEELIATGQDCELGPARVSPAALPVPPGMYFAEAGGASQEYPADTAGASHPDQAPLTVDVLFLYNTRALAVAAQRSDDPVGYMDGYTRAGLETCNLVLENSRVDGFVWRYVGLVAAPEYPEQLTVSDDLDMMAPGGPLDAFVRSARAQYGADQVLMWTGAGTRQGAAFAGDVRSEPAAPEYTLAGLRLTAGILILGHELAHNFG